MAALISYGQLTVQPADPVTNSLNSIVKSLAGQGVKVSNISSNMFGSSSVYGTFSEPSGQIGIKKGLLMTTGSIYNAVGPNDKSGKSTSNGDPGDADLTRLLNGGGGSSERTFDACVIEFDITTSSTQIHFNYIFGSEEYPEYVGQFNDLFAFFISGPGITGKQNIALIPGTPIPVSINNLNASLNNSYYRNNGNGHFGGGPILQYDGYTVKLKATANVTPCHTYHIKLAIADAKDDKYDSGVFIEEGSLTGSDALMIGNVIAPDSLQLCSSELPVTLKAGIHPVPNYEWFKDGVLVLTNNRYYDVLSPGWYVVKAYRDATCYWKDSIKIKVDQDFTLTTSPDTSICKGGSAFLNAVASGGTGPYSYLWTPGTSLSDRHIANPISTPVNTITYTVSVKEGKCSHEKDMTVTVLKPINLKTNSMVNGCINGPIQLNASGAENYVWTPGVYLNDSVIANPIATVPVNTIFKVKGYNACFSDSANILVSVFPVPPVKAYSDTTICYGGTASLSSDYFSQYQYSWAPASTLDDAQIYNPQATPKTNTNYILSINNNGCIRKDTVHVYVEPKITAKIFYPIPFGPIPWNVHLRNLSTGADSYTWYFTGFSSTQVKEPTITITQENYYTVILEALNNNGCADYDTLVLEAYKFFIPNLITPNNDGKNDSFEITGIGDHFSLEIYNRWGERIYKKDHYRNEWNGEGLSDGIYYYLINDPLYEKDYKGWVQLLR